MQTTTMSKQNLVDQAFALLKDVDFKMLKLKLQDPEEGLGWTSEECDIVELDYKRFLALKYAYPDEEIVPNRLVDKFWHFHILDTRAYVLDCEYVFGYFVHHYPYFGMMGEQDRRDLHIAFADTTALYKTHFGIGYDEEQNGGRSKCRTACKPQKYK